MESLLHQTNQALYQLNYQMEGLLRSNKMETTTEMESGDKPQQHIGAAIEEIYANCNKLNELVFKQPVAKRMSSKLKVDQIFYDVRHIEASFKNFLNKRKNMADENRRREELLNTKFTTNAEQSNDTKIAIEYALEHNSSLQSAENNLNEMLFTGSSTLEQLKGQRLSLKGIQKRMLDIGNILGLSNTVMRMIDKRGTQDKWIVYGGILLTCFIMFLAVKYLM